MPDVREVFRMATQTVRPDEGFGERQHGRQRRRVRNGRLSTIALMAAIALASAIVLARALPDDGARRPAAPPEERTSPPTKLVEFPFVATVQPAVDAPLVGFESARYGYSIAYPAIWVVKPAIDTLPVDGPPLFWGGGRHTTDYFSLTIRQRSDPGLVVAAQPLDRGTTLREWTSKVEGIIDTCRPPAARETVRVDGEKANLAYFPGCDIPQKFHYWTTIVHHDMGYHIIWIGNMGDAARDRAVLDRILTTFAFTD